MSEKNMKSVVGVQIGKVNASNGTDNYGLPIFIATDKPAWLLDWNGAMVAIDSLLKQIDNKASISEAELDALKVQIESANTAISGLQESTSSLTTNVAGLTADVTKAKKDVDAMQETVLQLTASVKTLETKVNSNSSNLTKMRDNILTNDSNRMHVAKVDDVQSRLVVINNLNPEGAGYVLLNMKDDGNISLGTMLLTLNFSDIFNNEIFTTQIPFGDNIYNVRFKRSRINDGGGMGVTVSTKKISETSYHPTNAIIISSDITTLV